MYITSYRYWGLGFSLHHMLLSRRTRLLLCWFPSQPSFVEAKLASMICRSPPCLITSMTTDNFWARNVTPLWRSQAIWTNRLCFATRYNITLSADGRKCFAWRCGRHVWGSQKRTWRTTSISTWRISWKACPVEPSLRRHPIQGMIGNWRDCLQNVIHNKRLLSTYARHVWQFYQLVNCTVNKTSWSLLMFFCSPSLHWPLLCFSSFKAKCQELEERLLAE